MPRNETTLGAALAKAGLLKHQMRAFTTCIEFIDAGGTREEWLQVYDTVARPVEVEAHRRATPGAAAPGSVVAVEPHISPEADIAARDHVRERINNSVWDKYVTSTGRKWAKVRYNELPAMGEDGALAIAVLAHIGLALDSPDASKRLASLISPNAFAQLAKKSGVKPN